MYLTASQFKFLRSADQTGTLRVSLRTYNDRRLGGKELTMALELVDRGMLYLDSAEFRNTARCAMKDHKFLITANGKQAMHDHPARIERTRKLIDELAAE